MGTWAQAWPNSWRQAARGTVCAALVALAFAPQAYAGVITPQGIDSDTEPPVVSCTAASKYLNEADFMITASDDFSGVHSLSYRLDSGLTRVLYGASVSFGCNLPGPHTITAWAVDEEGKTSAVVRRNFAILQNTRLSLTRSDATPPFGGEVKLTATLTGVLWGNDLPGRGIAFEQFDGEKWVFVASAYTTESGTASRMVVPYRGGKTTYRARYGGTTNRYYGSRSASVTVLPSVYVSKVRVDPTVVSAGEKFAIQGYLRPYHTSGTYPVAIYRWRYDTATRKWVRYGHWHARAYKYLPTGSAFYYTRYYASVPLYAAGLWRLRAYAPADALHSGTWSSGFDYVTVQ